MADKKEVENTKNSSIELKKETKVQDIKEEKKETKDELSVLKSMSKEDNKKAFKPIRKVRIDLIIFGVLIYILGISTGLFVGVGISQGDLSLTSFQRFFSSENQIQVQDIGSNASDSGTNNGIVINNAADVKSGAGGVAGGGGSAGGSGAGSAGGSQVTYAGDTPQTDGGGSGGGLTGSDSENYPVEDTTPKGD